MIHEIMIGFPCTDMKKASKGEDFLLPFEVEFHPSHSGQEARPENAMEFNHEFRYWRSREFVRCIGNSVNYGCHNALMKEFEETAEGETFQAAICSAAGPDSTHNFMIKSRVAVMTVKKAVLPTSTSKGECASCDTKVLILTVASYAKNMNILGRICQCILRHNAFIRVYRTRIFKYLAFPKEKERKIELTDEQLEWILEYSKKCFHQLYNRGSNTASERGGTNSIGAIIESMKEKTNAIHAFHA
eukprot:GEMP01095506.1.p1 GENE.GEMP01095506.1~~GEMP01095506.1.p1  ORF type:complete len:257 (+),score=11.01 GEMP01095506.1:37-771(+)